MKYLTRLNRNYFISFAVVAAAFSIVAYFIIQAIIIGEAQENLLGKELFIKNYLSDHGEPPSLYPLFEVKPIDTIHNSSGTFSTISIFDETEYEDEPYLEFAHDVKVGSHFYSVRIRQSVFESTDLVLIITVIFISLLVLAFLLSFFISRRINKTTWSIFEKNLHIIENFGFDQNHSIRLDQSNIEEFDRLNKVITGLTEKLSSDYLTLKEFTENASHEIQTPLTIALLQMEEMLQHDLNKEVFEKVVSSINALKRLSNLNQSLLMLAKIDNKQFKAEENIALNNVIRQKIKELEPLITNKKLDVQMNEDGEFTLKIHEQLADSLVANLLSNAIKHNVKSGAIFIEINSHAVKVCNTGELNNLTNKNVFDRFTRGNSKSYGLGLAIVKSICRTHHLDINYHQSDLHCFVIKHVK